MTVEHHQMKYVRMIRFVTRTNTPSDSLAADATLFAELASWLRENESVAVLAASLDAGEERPESWSRFTPEQRLLSVLGLGPEAHRVVVVHALDVTYEDTREMEAAS